MGSEKQVSSLRRVGEKRWRPLQGKICPEGGLEQLFSQRQSGGDPTY